MLVSIIIAGLVMGAIYGMVGLGYSIIFRASGIMNLAQSEMVTLASLIGVTLYQTLGLSFWLSLVLTMVIMFLFGALLQVGIVSRFNERGVKGIYMVLVTLGLSKIMNGSCELIFGANPVRFPPIFSVSTVKVLGTVITPERILSFFLSALAMLAIHLFLTRTKTGIATRACASDALAAEACGINVVNSNAIVWGLASASAAICGMMLGPIYGHYPGRQGWHQGHGKLRLRRLRQYLRRYGGRPAAGHDRILRGRLCELHHEGYGRLSAAVPDALCPSHGPVQRAGHPRCVKEGKP